MVILNSKSNLERHTREARNVKGFGRNWIQIPTPGSVDSVSEAGTCASQNMFSKKIRCRIDTVPLPRPVATQWKRRVNTYLLFLQSSQNLLHLISCSSTSNSECIEQGQDKINEKFIEANHTDSTMDRKENVSHNIYSMTGQCLLDEKGWHTFQWKDYDATNNSCEMQFKVSNDLSEEKNFEEQIELFLMWKEDLDLEENQALQTLLQRWSEKHTPPKATFP